MWYQNKYLVGILRQSKYHTGYGWNITTDISEFLYIDTETVLLQMDPGMLDAVRGGIIPDSPVQDKTH